MSTVIRLSRCGSKGNPFYRVVVADSSCSRDGKFIEKLGTFRPSADKKGLDLNKERIDYWLNVGAKPSKTVASLVKSI
ncbi:MAG: 30S ribosomal protein S16 [Oligoflexia bacterium]|nr:30S ribosomal protein S16 [Oligoflexia bacterium]